MHRAAPGVLFQNAVLCDGAEHLGGGIGFAMVVGKRYPHKRHRNAFAARLGNGRCRTGDQFAAAYLLAQRPLATGPVGVNQVVLHVQNQINTFHHAFPLG
ncbi:hypothetical protein D3C85_1586680 [compost metagenome]